MYCHDFMTRNELLALLSNKLGPTEINSVLAAYDMSESAYEAFTSVDGNPLFFHTTRVCRIILAELELFDHEILIASLLHEISKISSEVDLDIVRYNFGDYICCLIDILELDLHEFERKSSEFCFGGNARVKLPLDDCLIIFFAEQVDYLRCLDFDIKYNPISYIREVSEKYFPVAEKSENKHLKYLLAELKRERNKITG